MRKSEWSSLHSSSLIVPSRQPWWKNRVCDSLIVETRQKGSRAATRHSLEVLERPWSPQPGPRLPRTAPAQSPPALSSQTESRRQRNSRTLRWDNFGTGCPSEGKGELKSPNHHYLVVFRKLVLKEAEYELPGCRPGQVPHPDLVAAVGLVVGLDGPAG